jgi:2,4-dienoyl-CoA reductase-like NADH-dependent reductase (Old Yellow Enzyme family)
MRFTRAASESDLARIIAAFATAATVAADAGFDAIELHFGHGYLPSAFLSPRLNRRRDGWGGSLENRARLARQIALGVRERTRGRLAVFAKLNMRDGVRGGLELDEALAVALLLEADGSLDALELTGGSSFQNPMYLFRGEPPIAELAAAFPRALRLPFRLTAGRFLRHYPFEEAFFLPEARRFRAALRLPLVLLGGINRLATVRQALAEGFEFVAMGRALLYEPDLVRRWQAGDEADAGCTHCNRCMPTIYQGTHCVLVAPERRPGHRAPGFV